MAKFIIRKSKDNQFYFTFEAGNGQPVVTSEMYKQKHGCYTGIDSIIDNASDAEIIDCTWEKLPG